MTAGIPGAGIGGLFYLASTVVLPFRRLMRRLRGLPDATSGRQLLHSLCIAGGIIASLWLVGWLLAFLVPVEILRSVATTPAGMARARNVLPVATFATAMGTMLMVLGAVEMARYAQSRRQLAVRRSAQRR